ncbi:hypothetical protein BOTNAR_0429g00060 [Botryotinia narcissicola]|uniref:Uncharacterized protein n=1 Tax=Botryotinia narcissicola TaxID=278944 RepID=A0A4Z1HXG2_9HELO|nr:hypothetical protein BOTNAR_0429g00060 [Botryotinia narcissicola]
MFFHSLITLTEFPTSRSQSSTPISNSLTDYKLPTPPIIFQHIFVQQSKPYSTQSRDNAVHTQETSSAFILATAKSGRLGNIS